MSLINDASIFRNAVAQLQSEPGALPWLERRELARLVVSVVKAGRSTKEAMPLVLILAADPKWEVRLVLADALPIVPEQQFKKLREQLSRDGNSYVRAAVEKAVDSRLSRRRVTLKARKSRDYLSEEFLALELEHGTAVASRAKRLCEKHAEGLVGGLVHDLRSALTPLKASCATLVDDGAKREMTRSRVLGARIDTSLQLIESLLVNVAAFTQSIELTRRSEKLAHMVATAHELALNNLAQLGFVTTAVTAVVQVPDDLIVEAAHHQVVLAVSNVLKNAYESFVGEGDELGNGHIDVTGVLLAGRIDLVIRDNGMGMSEDEKRGFQAITPGNRNKSKRQSTGYGLPIARRYISAHGGSLTIESQEDKGTTVKITLPSAE
jgi:K+-sensing histidine kinase KdpD